METITMPVGRTYRYCGRCLGVDDACKCPPFTAMLVPDERWTITVPPEEMARLAALPSGSVLLGPTTTIAIDRLTGELRGGMSGPPPMRLAMTGRAWSALVAQVAKDERADRRRRRMARKQRRGWA